MESQFDWFQLLPILILIASSTWLAFARITPALASNLYLSALLASFGCTIIAGAGGGYRDILVNDSFALFSQVIVFIAAVAAGVHARAGNYSAVQHALLGFSCIGCLLVCSAAETMLIFLGLELAVVPYYILINLAESKKKQTSSSMIVLWGVVSSSFIAFALAMLFGLSGTTNLVQAKMTMALIQVNANGQFGIVMLLVNLLLLTGLLIKFLPVLLSQDGKPRSTAILNAYGPITMIVCVILAKFFVNGLFAFHDPVMSPNDWGNMLAVICTLWTGYTAYRIFESDGLYTLGRSLIVLQLLMVPLALLALSGRGIFAAALCMASYVVLDIAWNWATQIQEHRKPLRHRIILFVSLAGLLSLPGTFGFLSKFSTWAAAFESYRLNPMLWPLAMLAAATLLVTLFGLVRAITVFTKTMNTPDLLPAPKYKTNRTSPILAAGAAIIIFLLGIYPQPLYLLLSTLPVSFGFPPR